MASNVSSYEMFTFVVSIGKERIFFYMKAKQYLDSDTVLRQKSVAFLTTG